MQIKLTELRQQKLNLKIEHEQQLNELIRDKENAVNEYIEEKSQHYKQILLRDQLLKSEIENLKINENQQIELANNSYQRNIELIHLSYQDKLQIIKNKFFQVIISSIKINKF
jgi:Spy/CpxP family protein refolding chaperone